LLKEPMALMSEMTEEEANALDERLTKTTGTCPVGTAAPIPRLPNSRDIRGAM
jgi:hypothetical protein